MAKYEGHLYGDFDTILREIDQGIMGGSASASLEDKSDYSGQGVRCAVRVYERYSFAGGNRVSMNVTLIQDVGKLFVSAITAGGSQAVFFKLNTMGEESFLQCLIDVVEKYKR